MTTLPALKNLTCAPRSQLVDSRLVARRRSGHLWSLCPQQPNFAVQADLLSLPDDVLLDIIKRMGHALFLCRTRHIPIAHIHSSSPTEGAQPFAHYATFYTAPNTADLISVSRTCHRLSHLTLSCAITHCTSTAPAPANVYLLQGLTHLTIHEHIHPGAVLHQVSALSTLTRLVSLSFTLPRSLSGYCRRNGSQLKPSRGRICWDWAGGEPRAGWDAEARALQAALRPLTRLTQLTLGVDADSADNAGNADHADNAGDADDADNAGNAGDVTRGSGGVPAAVGGWPGPLCSLHALSLTHLDRLQDLSLPGWRFFDTANVNTANVDTISVDTVNDGEPCSDSLNAQLAACYADPGRDGAEDSKPGTADACVSALGANPCAFLMCVAASLIANV